MEYLVEVDVALPDVVVLAASVLVVELNSHLLVAPDLEGHAVLPDWVLAHVIGCLGLLGLAADGHLRVGVHPAEDLGVIGQLR